MIGIERSHISTSDVEPFIADLVWLGEALERARPAARTFIRPGFDEPEALSRFLDGVNPG